MCRVTLKVLLECPHPLDVYHSPFQLGGCGLSVGTSLEDVLGELAVVKGVGAVALCLVFVAHCWFSALSLL